MKMIAIDKCDKQQSSNTLTKSISNNVVTINSNYRLIISGNNYNICRYFGTTYLPRLRQIRRHLKPASVTKKTVSRQFSLLVSIWVLQFPLTFSFFRLRNSQHYVAMGVKLDSLI